MKRCSQPSTRWAIFPTLPPEAFAQPHQYHRHHHRLYFDHPYSGDIVRGVQDWAGANGRTVLLANTDGNAEREANIWRTFKAHRIDGVLYVAMYHRTVAPASGDVSIPTVLVNSHAEAGLTYSSIEPDDFGGSCALTQHLVELGHRRIGYIRLNPLLLGANQRLDAFLAATQAGGIAENDIIVRLGMEGPIGAETNYVYREALSILSMPNRPTALVCGNDEMALQAYLAALSLRPSHTRRHHDRRLRRFQDCVPGSKARTHNSGPALLRPGMAGSRDAERPGRGS